MSHVSLIEDLKSHREGLGWSLGDLARCSGLADKPLAAWESGVGSPPLDALQNWAAALGMRVKLLPGDRQPGSGVHIDWETRRITVDGAPVRLTPMEWRALERLARTPGELVSHQALFRHLYDEERNDRAQATAVRVLITKLRRLLPLRIEARWGQGYVVTGIDRRPGLGADRATARHANPEPGSASAREPEEAAVATRAVCRAGMVSPERLAPAAAPRRATPIRRDLAELGEHGLRQLSVLRRSEELGIIDRFLAERGATRCPDAATIQKSPLPTLVWDKVKRKWVRPVATERSAS